MASCLHLLLLLLCGAPAVLCQLRLFNLRATDLPDRLWGTTDGYVKAFLGSSTLGETSVRNDNPDPWWEEEFTSFSAQEGDLMRLEVYDSDLLLDDLLGVCQRALKAGTHTHDCYLKKGGTLHYSYTLGSRKEKSAQISQ